MKKMEVTDDMLATAKRMNGHHMEIGCAISTRALETIQASDDPLEMMAVYLQVYNNLLAGMVMSYAMSTGRDIEDICNTAHHLFDQTMGRLISASLDGKGFQAIDLDEEESATVQ